MGQQGERCRLALDLAGEEVDETGLEPQPRLGRGALDRQPQVGLGHRSQQVEAALDEPGELRVGGQLTEPVGPQ